jgi:hypothetical protein
LLSFPGVSYLDALDHIHKLNPVLPLLGYLFAPDRTRSMVSGFRAWMGRRGRTAAVIGATVVGVWLVARGVINLV